MTFSRLALLYAFLVNPNLSSRSFRSHNYPFINSFVNLRTKSVPNPMTDLIDVPSGQVAYLKRKLLESILNVDDISVIEVEPEYERKVNEMISLLFHGIANEENLSKRRRILADRAISLARAFKSKPSDYQTYCKEQDSNGRISFLKTLFDVYTTYQTTSQNVFKCIQSVHE